MPDCTTPVSAQVKEIATSVLSQPFAFASGSRAAVDYGDILSMLIPPTLPGMRR